MESSTDPLLALSNTAVALAEQDQASVDDDRSSSLSELEDAPENPEFEVTAADAEEAADSEAETERLNESPDKVLHKKPFGISPSKLGQEVTADQDVRPEIEQLTDSAMSSPMLSDEDPLPEDPISDNEEEEHSTITKARLLDVAPNNKRKRLSDNMEAEERDRIRRRRTDSPESDTKSDIREFDSELEDEDSPPQKQRVESGVEVVGEPAEDLDEEEEGEANRIDAETSKEQATLASTRSQRRRGKDPELPQDAQDADEDVPDESDEHVDVDDLESTAKSEEEQAKRSAAMDALMTLERHFAVLRDRLYDERIAAINHELAQLAEARPTHPELLKQLEAVRKHRDEKFDVEQKLLVYKIGALKKKSVAERAQVHSAYFQTVRDIRERHLERISEHFYRIQRERFKSQNTVPSYTIPFAEKRSQQIIQQMAYNKEVSVLSGVAKYVGFPAAPDLAASRSKEVDDDLEKMGLTQVQIRALKAPQRAPSLHNPFTTALSAPAAEEQFLEQNPWANAQHPIHKLGGLSRQNSNQSPFEESGITPAQPQRFVDPTHTAGSASTIPEHPSAAASSAINTPHVPISLSKNGNRLPEASKPPRFSSESPSDIRRPNLGTTSGLDIEPPASSRKESLHLDGSSPLTGKSGIKSPKLNGITVDDRISRQQSASPFRNNESKMIPDSRLPNGRLTVQ